MRMSLRSIIFGIAGFTFTGAATAAPVAGTFTADATAGTVTTQITFSAYPFSVDLTSYGHTTPTPGPLTQITGFTGDFAYDTATPANFDFGTLANYDAGDFDLTTHFADTSTVLADITDPTISISNGGFDVFALGSVVDQPTTSIDNPTPQSFPIDLVSLDDFAATFPDFPNLSQAIVHLTEGEAFEVRNSANGSFSVAALGLRLNDTTGTLYGSTDLPEGLELSDFNNVSLMAHYRYSFDITVDPDDYTAPADYQAVLDFLTETSFIAEGITAFVSPVTSASAVVVPEPATLSLFALAATGALCRRR